MYWALERRLTPQLRYSQSYFYDALSESLPADCDWLDIGCGHQFLPNWMAGEEASLRKRAKRIIGIDLDWEGLRTNRFVDAAVFGTGNELPFVDGSFDAVTCNMVVEHLEEPQQMLKELHRVLRPGGLFFFHTTNVDNPVIRGAWRVPQGMKNLVVQLLDGRPPGDVFPTHYRFNSKSDIVRLARESGFSVASLRFVSSSAVTAQLGPLAVPELLWLRYLEAGPREQMRTNIIGILKKQH